MTIPTIRSKEWSAIADLHNAGDTLRRLEARKDKADRAKQEADRVLDITRRIRDGAQKRLKEDAETSADSLLPALNALIQAETDVLEAEAAQYRAGTARETEQKEYLEAYAAVQTALKETWETARVLAAERFTEVNRSINGDIQE